MLTRRLMLQSLGAAWQTYYWGRDEALPKQIELSAGPVRMVFEPDLGFLRYIKLGDHEILRGIYAAVRDRNWGTVAPRVSGLKIETREDSFQLEFDVLCKEGAIDFLWRGSISGESNGTVRFAMKGDARSTFLRNRIGFAVLHPLKECAGKPCKVKHSDGRESSGSFPQFVSPDQPFKDMAMVSHTVAPGVTADVIFEGETFEMEDHRNWTDANYKTYCTPLEKPFPVEVKQGTKIEQAVVVKLNGSLPKPAATFRPRRQEVILTVSAGERKLPAIGLGLSENSLDERELKAIMALKPAHLRVDLKFGDPDHLNALGRAVLEAQRSQIPLEVALHLTTNAEAELRTLAPKLATAKIARYLVFQDAEKSTHPKWVKLAKDALRNAPVGCGTNAYFAELNRGRPDPAGIDFLCFSVNPQVHAFDNGSLVENLFGQQGAVESAHQFAGGKPLVVTPVTFKPRFNPNATGGGEKLPPDVLPPQVDPRQLSLFGAAWTLGSIRYLAAAGTSSVTYFETAGPRGVIERTAGSSWPKHFPSRASQTFPLYHVLADVLDMAGASVLHVDSSMPLAAEALLLKEGNRQRMLVANLSPEAQSIRVPWPGANRKLRIRKLDESTVRMATEAAEKWRATEGDTVILGGESFDLALGAYAVARLDSVA